MIELIQHIKQHLNLATINFKIIKPSSSMHGNRVLAWVLWISEVSVAILSPEATDSTRRSWRSIEHMGTAECSTTISPSTYFDREHRVATRPMTLKPPEIGHYLFSSYPYHINNRDDLSSEIFRITMKELATLYPLMETRLLFDFRQRATACI